MPKITKYKPKNDNNRLNENPQFLIKLASPLKSLNEFEISACLFELNPYMYVSGMVLRKKFGKNPK